MRKELLPTYEAMQVFKAKGHHMDITKFQIFLLVARHPHCRRRLLEEATGIGQSSIGRGTRALGAGLPTSKRTGPGLIVGYPDRKDPCRLCYVLSAEGRKLFKILQEVA